MQSTEEQNAKLVERFGNTQISDELRQQILPYINNRSLVIKSPNLAVLIDSRSEWGSSGGIGYYAQVRVFFGSQSEMQEWQWRDRYSASNDKPWLVVNAIGEVKVSEKGSKIVLEVELINNDYKNRTATYTFDPSKQVKVRTLSTGEQDTFTTQAEQEINRVMSGLNRLWECKPKMPNPHPTGLGLSESYVRYRQPSIKQRLFRPEIGVAAFVTEEQIDHRVDDPQIRYELYVLTFENQKAERKAEDHAYDRAEGGAFLTILEVGADHITINTKRGKSTISL